MKKPCLKCNRVLHFDDGRRNYCDACRSVKIQTPWSMRRFDCAMCGSDISHRRQGNARFCEPCAEQRRRKPELRGLGGNEMARKIFRYAVKLGFLQPASGFDCVDCGKPAECYDHRDYSKPLDVEPVCIPCNSSRGTGIPFIAPNSKHVAA